MVSTPGASGGPGGRERPEHIYPPSPLNPAVSPFLSLISIVVRLSPGIHQAAKETARLQRVLLRVCVSIPGGSGRGRA